MNLFIYLFIYYLVSKNRKFNNTSIKNINDISIYEYLYETKYFYILNLLLYLLLIPNNNLVNKDLRNN